MWPACLEHPRNLKFDILFLGSIIPKMGLIERTAREGQGHRGRPERPDGGLAGSSLADALLTRTQQRVLAILFGQPGRSFYVNEIIARAGVGRGAVQRELSRLAKSRLAAVSKVGNQKHYQANHDSPLFKELCGIIQKTVGLEEPFRAALKPLAGKLILALIFGSVAKRTDTAASDIDLLLVSDEVMLDMVYDLVIPLEQQLDRRVNPILLTSEEFRHRRAVKETFLTRVLEGPKIVLAGSADGA